MLAKPCLGILLPLALCACTSFQPSAGERGVAFKLRTCTSQHFHEAWARLTATDVPLEFHESWVCVTPPLEDQKHALPAAKAVQAEQASQLGEKTREEAQAFLSPSEEALRDVVEGDFIKKEGGRPAFGVALSGGGSKASAFGVGVLAGLADIDMLDSASYVSSVSGGSYAAYFYYAHRIFPQVPGRGHAFRPSTRQLFWDCVLRRDDELADPAVIAAVNAYGPCEKWKLRPDWSASPPETPRQDNRYQALLRCQQDVFNPGVCSTNVTTRDAGVSMRAAVSSVALFPLSGITGILFDWGVNPSPSAQTYRNGIGVGYGTTVTDPAILWIGEQYREGRLPCSAGADSRGYALDCERTPEGIRPEDLTFQELRAGLLAARKPDAVPLPFWIINAAAPRYRSGLGWWTVGSPDTTNSDMFEMTAVSHGSGRYGYVPGPVSLYDMSVLDAVAASAAFLDSSQLKYRGPAVRGSIGMVLRVANLDWGVDIPNYNVSDASRNLHKALPIPFFYLDGAYRKFLGEGAGSAEKQDRVRSAFIRLVDGGNAENLGVYSLLKRGVRTIVISDAAADPRGDFSDICGLKARLSNAPATVPRHLYIPGLADLEGQCQRLLAGEKQGYDLRAWPFRLPVLVGCLRLRVQPAGAEPCASMSQEETRLVVVKPAIHLENLVRRQLRPAGPGMPVSASVLTNCLLPGRDPGPATPLINCDTAAFVALSWFEKFNQCQPFPQHSTVTMTVNSSATLFGAYRELARQYVRQAEPMLKGLAAGSANAVADFERHAREQRQGAIQWREGECDPGGPPTWLADYLKAG